MAWEFEEVEVSDSGFNDPWAIRKPKDNKRITFQISTNLKISVDCSSARWFSWGCGRWTWRLNSKRLIIGRGDIVTSFEHTNLCVYTCVYVPVCTRIYVRMYIFMHACTYAFVCTYRKRDRHYRGDKYLNDWTEVKVLTIGHVIRKIYGPIWTTDDRWIPVKLSQAEIERLTLTNFRSHWTTCQLQLTTVSDFVCDYNKGDFCHFYHLRHPSWMMSVTDKLSNITCSQLPIPVGFTRIPFNKETENVHRFSERDR